MLHAQYVLKILVMNGRKMSKSEVKIFDSRYLLTADGKVFSLIFTNGACSRPRSNPYLLKQGTSTNGYKYVHLSAKSGAD